MKPLGETLSAIQKIVDVFDGGISIKNAKGQFFFVNDAWLKLTGLQREEVIGKTAEEVLSPDNVITTKKTDAEALQKKTPIEYVVHTVLKGVPVSVMVIKWAVYYNSGELFSLCTLCDTVEQKERVLAFREKVAALFELAMTDE